MKEMEYHNNKIEYQVIKTKYDYRLLYIVVGLISIGVMAVASATFPMCLSKHLNAFYYIVQHIVWIILGWFGLRWFTKYNYKNLKQHTFSFAIFVIVLLLIVKFTPLGVTINHARRWLNLGLFQFQPSEFTKLAVIMLFANLFSIKNKIINEKGFMHFLLVGIMLGLVLIQPNLSMVLILSFISLLMYFVSGRTLKYVGISLIIPVALVVLLKMHVIELSQFLQPHQISRIHNFTNPKPDIECEGYQVYHSMIAIASGGFFGQGFGASKEKLGWLPEAHTDFIFSVIAEEMGYLGCFIIVLLFLTLFTRGLLIGYKCPDMYGRLLAIGITNLITIQAFFNISVATSFLPATGITLPFISYGGSSLFVCMCLIGILLNISKTQTRRVFIKGRFNEK